MRELSPPDGKPAENFYGTARHLRKRIWISETEFVEVEGTTAPPVRLGQMTIGADGSCDEPNARIVGLSAWLPEPTP